MNLSQVQKEAANLSPDEQVALLEWLWDGLQSPNTQARQDRWAAESEDRINAVDRGALPTVDGEQALGELRRTLEG